MPNINLTFVRPSKGTEIFVHGLIEDTDKLIISDFTFKMPRPFIVDGRPAVIPGDRGILFEHIDGYEVVAVAHDGRLTGHYININLPFERTKDGYLVKDMFLDIWIWPDGSHVILDEDEFNEACQKGWISDKEIWFTLNLRDRLVSMIRKNQLITENIKAITERWLGSQR